MSKIKIVNYYDGLSTKQKEKLEEKASVCCYYSYYDELKKYEISNEQAGILFLALTFYGKTHGQEELPTELSEPIEQNPLLCYIFETWCQRERSATLNWVNHRGGNSKSNKATAKTEKVVIEETPVGRIELVGNKKNMPKDDDFSEIVESIGYEFANFIKYGNICEWDRPFTDILEEYEEKYG